MTVASSPRTWAPSRDNFLVKHRYALNDSEGSEWEKNPDGKPRDPWAKAYRALLIEGSPPHGDVTLEWLVQRT